MSVRDCSRHRAWLVARAATAGTAPGAAAEIPADVASGLDGHLAACRACRTEVEELALLSFAIRRAWRDTGGPEPPADAWPRLRERVSRPRSPRRLAWAASSIAGVAMGTALAIGLIAPLGPAHLWGGDALAILDEAGSPVVATTWPRSRDDLAELDWMREREGTHVIGIGYSRLEPIPATGPRAVFATLRRDQSRYAEDRWDERPPAASEVPTAVVL